MTDTFNQGLSCELLRQLIDYNPETGDLTWKERGSEIIPDKMRRGQFNSRLANTPALNNVGVGGYKRGLIFGTSYRAHRVAWAIYYGEWPSECVDHINGIRTDNRIENLRLLSRTENARNAFRYRTNSSGYNGVCWDKNRKRWFAYIRVDGRLIQLGKYSDIAEAVAARKAADAKYGYTERHGEARETLLAALTEQVQQ